MHELNIQIRPAEPGDTGAIVAILEELAREDNCTSFDADRVGKLIREYVDATERTIYVADRGGVAGYAAVHWIPFPMLGGWEGYISDLVVGSAGRGSGIGSRLLAVVEDRAGDLGCRRLMLNNRITSESYQREFYAKHGFQRRDKFANFVKILDGTP